MPDVVAAPGSVGDSVSSNAGSHNASALSGPVPLQARIHA
jgi:hypothetical protein